jgi:Interferon-induced transmembrane protein
MIASLNAAPVDARVSGEEMAIMSYGDIPGGEQGFNAGPAFGAPPPYLGQPWSGQRESMPPTYRAWGIIAIICGVLFNTILGLPAAILGFRFGGEARQLWANGDAPAAIKASRKARAWLIASSVLDVLGIILIVVIITQASSSNFNNPSVVAASIKSQVQRQLSDKNGPAYDPGVTVTSVTCTRSGANTDHCVIRFSDGSALTQTATISGDGTSYSAKS